MGGGFIPNLQYPIFTIQGDGNIYITTQGGRGDAYRRWSKSLANDEHYYKSLKILDALGGLYKISRVEILKTGSLFNLNLLLTQQVIANTYVELIDTPMLSKITEILSNGVSVQQDYYESADIDWKDLQHKIEKAHDLKELFELFAYAQGAPGSHK